MLMLKIAFDIDDCTLDTSPYWKRNLMERFPDLDYQLVNNPPAWDLRDFLPLSGNQIWKSFEYMFGCVKEIKPFPGVTEFLTRLHERTGKPVHFVTSRPARYATETYLTLERNFNFPFTVAFASGRDKLLFLDGYGAFVDDKGSTCQHLAKNDIFAFMPVRSHNADTPIMETGRGVIPINHFSDLERFVNLMISPVYAAA